MPHKVTTPTDEHLPPVPDQCPSCGSPKLTIFGALRRPIKQGLENGQLTGERVLSQLRDIVWDRISCVRCGFQCERTDERLVQLKAEVEELQLKLAFVTGRLRPENSLPC